LIEKMGPLATTSANVSGEASPTVIDESNPVIIKADFVFDGGATKEQIPSTILDCTVNPPVILRPGAISEKKISEVMHKI
ncbi:MAG: L-threonylcarbamoyladenylate synthase, partial [Turicibacter sp.]